MVVFAIQGPSCCGKTSITEALLAKPSFSVQCILHQDDFYLQEAAFHSIQRTRVRGKSHLDFDHPSAIDIAGFEVGLVQLGQTIIT